MDSEKDAPNPLKEITQPFVDFAKSPRALWGVNLTHCLEGFVYFGMVTYMAMYFNEHVGLTDTQAGPMVGFLTWGITLSMFFFGGLADKWGVRGALLAAFGLMVVGRTVISASSYLGFETGMWSPVHLISMAGLFFIILGYGMQQPAAYAAVRLFTTPKTAPMAYAMLYAFMNLGGWLPSFFGPIRRSVGINGAYWVYTGITVLSLLVTFFVLSKRIIEKTTKEAEEAKKREGEEEAETPVSESKGRPSIITWAKKHPLADAKFAFFIFCLIPVQTLFAHNWLTIPMYVERAFRGTTIGENFELAVNLNPLLVFVLVPIVTALTQKRKVYGMMIAGTFVMAAPAFLLALGPSVYTLFGYLFIMTVGEAMWQPRFLQYAAEIAPKGRTGAYMGVAQFPWFMTKMITSFYSGWFLAKYCPNEGPLNTEYMWLIYGAIAMSSTVMLILARGWVGKDFKTKA